jgi:hypothetical protein
MIVYWLRKGDKSQYYKIFFNGIGALSTFFALMIIIAAKFTEGAWIVILIAPLLVFIFYKINKHYTKISREISKPLKMCMNMTQKPIVIIPINGWDKVANNAVTFGLHLSNDVTAIYISTKDNEDELIKTWQEKVEEPAKKAKSAVPHLEIIKSPYRRIYKPIIDYVHKINKEHPNSIIAVIIPELIEAHWYEYLLHNIHAEALRALLLLEGDRRTIVICTPWYVKDN